MSNSPDKTWSTIASKIAQDEPVSTTEARELYEKASLADLSQLATMAKKRLNSADEATYLKMGIINYTNVCVAKCDYCAFYRLPHEPGTYTLSHSEVFQRIDSLRSYGCSLAALNGGFHPKLRIEDYARLFEALHHRYPDLTFFEMTVAEFMFTCKLSKVSYEEGAQILKSAATKWITGGGAEILSDSFRKRHSPGKYSVKDYFAAQKAVLEAGIGSTATMVIGFDESLEERFAHLKALRAFQEQLDRRLTSMLCWTYKPYNTELGGQEISSDEYLRWLAICRIYLHNFKHIRTSILTQNENALNGLNFGADDFDLPVEDEVTEKAGAVISLEFDKILAAAKDLGFKTTYRKPWPIGS